MKHKILIDRQELILILTSLSLGRNDSQARLRLRDKLIAANKKLAEKDEKIRRLIAS